MISFFFKKIFFSCSFFKTKKTKLLIDHPTVYLAVIGGGPSADEWKVKHGAENRIFCLGEHWSGDKLSEAYASADIFVCPSKFETLGNVVLEAMASGVASVGCNAGGIPHMIKHGVTGLLFPEDDGPALSKAIGEVRFLHFFFFFPYFS